ncbi:hypothetical protein GCM10011494_36430 [Novosphingobium endophyticum]|uniref:Uncharacterized protein n=1 Tax=Novosphingobium endophyticum TaxID=1955250 RepID=A0A916X747_9SPHN|nr:hypothetical protein GCM10011494_36430 [Novosphingobium endophyticum]
MIIKGREFDLVKYSVSEVCLRLRASDGSVFKMHVSADGLEFYSDESSSGGGAIGKPVRMSVDDIWEWVGKQGDRVALADRVEVQRSRNRK